MHISHVMRKRRFPLIARRRARVLETRPKTVYRILLGKTHVTVLLSKRNIEKLATEHVLWPLTEKYATRHYGDVETRQDYKRFMLAL